MSMITSRFQFAFFRIIFGVYLIWHFILLIPFSAELFSSEGILGDPKLNLTYGIFPSPFWISDSSYTAIFMTSIGALLSISFTLGYKRKISAFIIWYILASLFNRNMLISNPSLPYVGLALLLTLFIPSEGYSVSKNEAEDWKFPRAIYWTAWIALAVGYTFSGIVKLDSPSWADGTAIYHLVTNPLARPSILRDLSLNFPIEFFKVFTWISLAGEILFLPLSFSRKTRFLAWLVMFMMHLGILSMVAFADLTFGMLIFHLFVFDAGWLPARKGGLKVLFFDGSCGFCNASVQTFSELDQEQVISFAPLQGQTAESTVAPELRNSENLSSVVYLREDNKVYTKSSAIIKLLNDVGGVARIISWVLFVIPGFIRDYFYDQIAKYRYLILKNPVCKIPTADQRKRILN